MRKFYSTFILASLVLLLSSGCSSKGMQKLSIQDAMADTASNQNFHPNIPV
jgi:PBP1b-binding outer membrane lipoprotein LpoB